MKMKTPSGFHAKKSLGQNFLRHRETLQKIIDSADLTPTDHIVEIGPGHGILTEELAKRAKHVTAIELDDRLIPELRAQFINTPNVTILHADALTFAPPETPYKIVANIPYYITSPLLNHFLREQPHTRRPQQLTLLVQKEVAKKIIASNGKHSVLSLQVHLFGTPSIVAIIPPEHFLPAPKVDSAILSILTHPCPLAENKIKNFFLLLHIAFAHPRKKLIKNLRAFPCITQNQLDALFKKLNLDENIRAEDISLKIWISIQHHMEIP